MSDENKKDTVRALEASKLIVDGRSKNKSSEIMVTLEHTVATVLIALYPDAKLAVGMLNEAVIQGVEARISLYYTGKYPI